MEAGRETDAIVARVVFKWRPLLTQDGSVRELWPPTVDPFSPKPDWSQCAEPPDWGLVPYFSTSISDAWRIVVKMTDRMGAREFPDFNWEGPLYKPANREIGDASFPLGASCWYVRCTVNGEVQTIAAAEAPLAVCLAALKIIESEEQINRDLKEISPLAQTEHREQE